MGNETLNNIIAIKQIEDNVASNDTFYKKIDYMLANDNSYIDCSFSLKVLLGCGFDKDALIKYAETYGLVCNIKLDEVLLRVYIKIRR